MSERVSPPEGFAAPPPPGPAPHRGVYRPGTARAVVAVTAACLLTAAEVVTAVFAIAAKQQFIDYARSGRADFSPDYRIAYYLFAAGTAALLLLAYLTTCLWLWNARRNAEALAPAYRHKQGRGWVWGSWLTPVVALWFPFMVVRDVVAATGTERPELPGRGEPMPHGASDQVDARSAGGPMKVVLGLWWGLWLSALVASQVSSRIIPWSGDPSASDARGLVWAEAINAALMLAALPFWITIIVAVDRSQKRVADGWHNDTAQSAGRSPGHAVGRDPGVGQPPREPGRERPKAGAAWVLIIVPALAVAGFLFLGAVTVAALTDVVNDPVGARANDDSGADGSGDGAGAAGTKEITDLARGDCLAQELPEEVPETVKVVPCTSRHFHEVFGAFVLSAGPYPGNNKTQQLALDRCLRAFRGYIGVAPRNSELDVVYLYPTDEQQWKRDSDVICLVSGATSTTSRLAGSRR